jgi:hypothetical protein
MKPKILKSSSMNYVEITVEIKHETEKAYRVTDGENEHWIPKSQLEDDPEHISGSTYTIIIPEWLAQSKGLI